MPQRILAVELAGDRVRAAMAERAWNSFQFVGVFENQRASDEPDLGEALARLVAQAGRPDIVISALPTEFVSKRLLELPFGDSRRLKQVVPFALEEHLPFPVDGAVVAFTRVGHEGSQSLVLAAFARKADVQHHLEVLAKGGLDPKIVTLAPVALAALFARARNGSSPRPHLVIETDQTSTSMVLIDAKGIPRAIRSVGPGLVTGDGGALAANEAAGVLNAVRQTLLAQAADSEPPQVILTGPGATIARLRNLFAEGLSLAVCEGGEFDCSAMFEGQRPDTARFAAAVAMLLAEAPVKPVELLNFRQDDLAFRGRTGGDLTPFYTTGILAAAMAATLVLNFVLGLSTSLQRLSMVNSQIAEIAAPALGGNDVSDPMAQLRSGISDMSKRLRLLGGNLSHNSPLNTLLTASQALPSRFPVEIEDIQIDATGLRLSGQADSFATVDQVQRALEQSGQFGEIPGPQTKKASDPNKVEFRLSADFKYGLGEGN
ncbi:MAG TPA: PilN domain-containing protein [Candidatus Binataceae bacterium]|nr:PilN domain-containing protein [Candidatus Binataceae bacterium]